jgi:short-subunit dehydrogenase
MSRWTLITGASEGLGVEFAKIAARKGHNMILTARSADKLNALAETLRTSDGVEVVVIPTDLNSPTEVEALWAKAAEGRDIGILINNAGLGRNGAFADGGATSWARELSSIDVNVTALTRLMKLAVPHMQTNGSGRILNVSSVAGFVPGPNMAVYHATKAYVLSLSEALAREVKGSGVTVTALCPGATKTNFANDADMHGVRLFKMGKPASAADVAMAGWLAAKAGETVAVPGLMNKAFAALPRFVPRRFTTRLTAYFMAKA